MCNWYAQPVYNSCQQTVTHPKAEHGCHALTGHRAHLFDESGYWIIDISQVLHNFRNIILLARLGDPDRWHIDDTNEARVTRIKERESAHEPRIYTQYTFDGLWVHKLRISQIAMPPA